MANLGARSPVGQIRENSGAAAKYVPPETRARHAVKIKINRNVNLEKQNGKKP